MKNNDRARLLRLLDAEREPLNAATRQQALHEFTRVADEYFERTGECTLTAAEEKNELLVTVTFRCARVKNLTPLP